MASLHDRAFVERKVSALHTTWRCYVRCAKGGWPSRGVRQVLKLRELRLERSGVVVLPSPATHAILR